MNSGISQGGRGIEGRSRGGIVHWFEFLGEEIFPSAVSGLSASCVFAVTSFSSVGIFTDDLLVFFWYSCLLERFMKNAALLSLSLPAR